MADKREKKTYYLEIIKSMFIFAIISFAVCEHDLLKKGNIVNGIRKLLKCC